MTDTEIKRIMATKAPESERLFILILLEDISLHHSSLIDYIDAVLGYDREGMNMVDEVILEMHLGAVYTLEKGHYGTVLPVIDRGGHCVGGCVLFVDTDSGKVIR